MGDRKALSKRVRFEVFKRDGFRCAYCGSTPLDGALHVDHVAPVAGGGSDEPANLITSCAACNLGKSDIPLGDGRLPTVDPEFIQEQAEQLAAWTEAQRAVLDARKKLEQQMVDLWCEAFGLKRCDADVPGRLLKLLNEWPMAKLLEALSITSRKHGLYDDVRRLRYMYGVIRNWRAEMNGER